MVKKYLIVGSLIFVLGIFVGVSTRDTFLLLKSNYTIPDTAKNAKSASSVTQVAKCEADDSVIVTKVIDGDTVVVEGGEHVRLLGIDADEKDYSCFEPAKMRLESWVLNKQVRLEKDITDIDQYQRCLRTVFLGGENINVQLVKEGLAVARFYEPDIKHKNEISLAEKQAIENKTGCKWNNVF